MGTEQFKQLFSLSLGDRAVGFYSIVCRSELVDIFFVFTWGDVCRDHSA